MKLVAFLGYSGSGKTSAIYELTKGLASFGFRVGTIKHSHKHLDLDKKNKDSWVHSDAGASVVFALSPYEVMILKKGDFKRNGLDFALKMLRPEVLDFVLIEGFHNRVSRLKDVFTILCSNSQSEAESLMVLHPKPNYIVSRNQTRWKSKSIMGVKVLSLPGDLDVIVKALRTEI